MRATITTTTSYGNHNMTVKYGKNSRFLCFLSSEAADEAKAAYTRMLTTSGYTVTAA
tara:strand:- start:12216 stop:12386 length:171 start_codon:yes stop_codon:yes gene_type:complete